jgi:hypothetical protein
MFALIASEELDQLGQVMIKQLKNRYNDPNRYKRFVVGIDKSRMKLYDAEASAQDDISDSGAVFDKTPAGQRDSDGTNLKPKFDKSKFDGFK